MQRHNWLLITVLSLLTACQTINTTQNNHSNSVDEQTGVTVTYEEPDQNIQQIEPPAKVVQITDLWQRIQLGLTFDTPDQQLVNQYRQWYLNNPQYLKRVSARALPFLYLIVEEIEQRNLPMELALLPIVESAFDPFAYSHGAASGLWQFTSPMAKHFGLDMNWWYDGRRDVPAATVAALDMMEYLYGKTYNNWLYAIAAYNTGEGRVRNAVKRVEKNGKKADFWALTLPTETERYVPQLLALADVIKNADRYGIKLTPIPNTPQIEVIDIGSQIDLALAAELAQLSLKELHQLNPGYNRWATSPTGPHTLVLPVTHATLFTQALAKIDLKQRVQWERYQIKTGDSLGVIAQKYKTTSSAIRSINNLADNTIIAGKYLLIPVASKKLDSYSLSANQRKLAKQNRQRNGIKIEHKVKAGDSFWELAKKHNVSINQLAAWNSMAPKEHLRIGQTLVIWSQSDTANNYQEKRTVHYTVRSGDSLARIASKFKVTVSDLIRWNRLEQSKYIQPGQKIKLYVDAREVRA